MQQELLLIGSVSERMLNKMQQRYRVTPLNSVKDPVGYLIEHGSLIKAVATNGHDGVPTEVLQALPNLELVSCYGVGYDAVDVNKLVERQIILTHTPGVLNRDVANTAVLLMLALSRQLLRDDKWARSGAWAEQGAAPVTRSIEGAVVGMLGMGRIGQTIAEKMQAAFACKVLYHTRNARPDLPYEHVASLQDMARRVDYLVVITPGGAGTRHLVNAEVLGALGSESSLVNIARGSVVDEEALITALQQGSIASAGLDVFEQEPHIPEALTKLNNVLLLPHVGSATVETRQAMGDLVTDNLASYQENACVISPVPECRVFLTKQGDRWIRCDV